MPSFEVYREEMQRNLVLMSRTANGIVDTSASPDKAGFMLIQSGNEAKEIAMRNVEKALRYIYDHRCDAFPDADAFRRFLLQIAKIVNAGVLPADHLMRSGMDSDIYKYVRVQFVPDVFSDYLQTIHQKINAVPYDAVEAACFSEYAINLTGHFFADGCGKCAMLTAAFLLMRDNLHLPNYRSVDEYYHAKQFYPDAVGSDYIDKKTYETFLCYYRTLF